MYIDFPLDENTLNPGTKPHNDVQVAPPTKPPQGCLPTPSTNSRQALACFQEALHLEVGIEGAALHPNRK